jgi:hypothetical protein
MGQLRLNRYEMVKEVGGTGFFVYDAKGACGHATSISWFCLLCWGAPIFRGKNDPVDHLHLLEWGGGD